uniref:uncharacterized protein LOC100184772 isoform X2 n=1 Tax=Ciona intestinalis TaxID=7719 RepID=UPI000EF506F3|nr:uncharacterized protein LOC100184772 isoform X2 [Ciona intestinalis]|eukprot:XP_026689508.1 uncharacterized protein LOC100184772 isoform X2 [Ciona intestinalis]
MLRLTVGFVLTTLLWQGAKATSLTRDYWGHWSPWGACSVSCDIGHQTRTRACQFYSDSMCDGPKVQQRPCNKLICPSYLDVPRFHFKGKYVVDSPTNNNNRCYFNTKYFSPTFSTGRGESASPTYSKHGNPKYRFSRSSHNPMGNGHFDFYETAVTSVCRASGKSCTNLDLLVTRKITGTNAGRMVDLDNDWMNSPEVIGYKIQVDGVFVALMENGPSRQIVQRIVGHGGDLANMASIKSKLINVEWLDIYYQHMFRNATSLSISFAMDLFNVHSKGGRLVGTIGMTSQNDPRKVYGGRVLRPMKGKQHFAYEIPLFVNEKLQRIVLDLSSFVKSDKKGNFKLKNQLKYVDVIVLPNPEICKVVDCKRYTNECDGIKTVRLTDRGTLSYIQNGSTWYTILGGLVELNIHKNGLSHALATTRIGLIDRTTLHPQTHRHSYKLCDLLPKYCTSTTHKAKPNCQILALEDEAGINFKPTGGFTKRLSRGETWNIETVASSFGRPLEGADMSLMVMKQTAGQDTCSGTKSTPCSPYVGRPRSALQLSSGSILTDVNGNANLTIKAVSNPGNPRGCGMDGQVYHLGMIVSYKTPEGKVIRIGDGAAFSSATSSSVTEATARKQCHLTSTRFTFGFMLKVFGSLPASVMRKRCPSWTKDIRPIFQLYYNLYPVMHTHDVINLRSVGDVRSKLRMINMSMFEYDWNHPNFMPTTRDLSPDKTEIVRRWLECEMNGTPEDATSSKRDEMIEARNAVCGTPNKVIKTMEEIRNIIQMGIWVELYTIPPYMTAMLSLKREKFKEVYNILKSVSTEEMLHMVLNANVLNSIGGKPNTTDTFWLPDYPTTLPSMGFYQIRPDITLTIAPFSRAIVKDVFMEIEKPASPNVMTILHNVALMWARLPGDAGGRWKSFETEGKTLYADTLSRLNASSGPVWLRRADSLRSILDTADEAQTEDSNDWRYLFQTATELLENPEIADVYTIGGFYAHAMLRLIQAEACVKMDSPNNTVFTGDPTRQFGPEQWYVTKGLSSATLFPVHGLKSAIEALMEVVYEGEGGTPCAPFITEIAENENSVDSNSGINAYNEKSHYVKFQEITHGRKLVPVSVQQPQWPEGRCLQQPVEVCGNNSNLVSFCFQGESIAFTEANNVLPGEIVDLDGHYLKSVSAVTKHLIYKFTSTYTGLLQCLEMSMNGNVSSMKKCMGIMYELLSAGKKLVKTPIRKGSKVMNLPVWTYQRDPYKKEGLHVVQTSTSITDVFC